MLVNETSQVAEDMERRIARTKAQIEAARHRAAEMESGMEQTLLNQDIREMSSQLEELETQRREVSGSTT